MKYVLITLSEGSIDQVTFYEKPYEAVASLFEYVRAMDPEKNDAVVYGADEMIANAK